MGGDTRVLDGDPAALEIAVMVLGPEGTTLSRFGHSALWVRDTVQHVEAVFNYGLSATYRAGFYRDLITGHVTARPAIRTSQATISHYAAADRSVESLVLNLGDDQKATLVEVLRKDLTGRALGYRHDFFLDNCTTPVRDLIDIALGGQLRRDSRQLEDSYRSLSAPYIASDLPLFASVELVLGRRADRPLSSWEAMFLPFTLRDALLETTIVGEGGNATALVSSHEVLYRPEAMGPDGSIIATAGVLTGTGGFALLLLLVGGLVGARFDRATDALIAVGSLWLGATGVSGVLVLTLWLFMDQQWAAWNANLLLANPLSLATMYLLWGGEENWRLALRLHLLVAVGAVAVLVIKLLPGVVQGNGLVVAVMLPGHVGLAVALWHVLPRAERLAGGLAGQSVEGTIPLPGSEAMTLPTRGENANA